MQNKFRRKDHARQDKARKPDYREDLPSRKPTYAKYPNFNKLRAKRLELEKEQRREIGRMQSMRYVIGPNHLKLHWSLNDFSTANKLPIADPATKALYFSLKKAADADFKCIRGAIMKGKMHSAIIRVKGTSLKLQERTLDFEIDTDKLQCDEILR